MKAIVMDGHGGPEVLRYDDAPEPEVGENEVLVQVHATAVNRADVLQRRGGYAPPPGASPLLGLELAGVVAQRSANWRAGDRVMAVVTGGGYAERAAVPSGMLMPIPEHLPFTQAAAIPEAFLTAYLNLFTLGNLRADEHVLIHAGASGVGTAAIQLARAAGAHVLATAGSDDKLARCQELGAEVAINYKTESFADRVKEVTDGRGVDLILDFVGAPYWASNMDALALRGRIMLIGVLGGSQGQLDLGPIMGKSATVKGTTLRRTPMDDKIELTRTFASSALHRFANGELQPVIDRVFPLAEAAEAHRFMESNANVGKLILQIAE